MEPVGYVVLMSDGELWLTGTPRRPRLYKNGGTATAALKIVFGRVPAGYRIVPVGPVGTDFPIKG